MSLAKRQHAYKPELAKLSINFKKFFRAPLGILKSKTRFWSLP